MFHISAQGSMFPFNASNKLVNILHWTQFSIILLHYFTFCGIKLMLE